MWWAVDVHYRPDAATVAAVGLGDPGDPEGTEVLLDVPGVPAGYEPGAFWKRELPLILAVLADRPLTAVIVDGYAWLGPDRPGLGAHVHRALGVPVIGVAKTSFAGAESVAEPVLRGVARRPLHVTAAGMPLPDAVRTIASMHGPFRLPTVLRRVDRLCRDGVA